LEKLKMTEMATLDRMANLMSEKCEKESQLEKADRDLTSTAEELRK
jgi:hypothetical protein